MYTVQGSCLKFRNTDWIIVYILFWSWSCCCFPSKYSGEENERIESLVKSMSFNHMAGVVTSSWCPETGHSYFTGARIRWSNFLNQSLPSINAVEFTCSDGIHARVKAEGILLLQKNVGTWTPVKECSKGGFVTGITFHLQSVNTESLIADEELTLKGSIMGNFFDIFELGRSRFISGISLNCSFSHMYDETSASVENNDMVDGSTLWPIKWNAVTLGRASGMGLRLYCIENRVIKGISLGEEALITYKDGERWIPLEMSSTCSIVANPVVNCYPELDWESLDNLNCTNSVTGRDAMYPHDSNQTLINVTCTVPHFVGLSPNPAIENLSKILHIYKALDLEGMVTKRWLRLRLFSNRFKTDWQREYKLTQAQYNAAVLSRRADTYLGLKEDSHVANFTNVQYDEPEYCQEIRNKTLEPLHYAFNVKQLVGYCSIYKIYFPLFQNQFQIYFERHISGIRSRIIFPGVDDSDTLYTLLQTKYGAAFNL